MGCITSKENGSSGSGHGSGGTSRSKGDDVEAVIPGTVTTFGAKYLVPHGKRVYLSFDKQALLEIVDKDESSLSFVITDVTNGQEHETAMFLVERNTKVAEAARVSGGGGSLVVKDPMRQQVIFTVGPGVVYAAPPPDGEERLLFGISSNRTSGDCMATEGLVNRQGKPIQLVIDDFSSSGGGAIFLMLPPGSLVTNKKNKSKKSPRQLIARMICNDTENVIQKQLPLSSDYVKRHVIMEITPGVDMALMVAMNLGGRID